LPNYRRWGEGFGATSAVRQPPSPSDARPDWRYFGGYNALYGFGR
jgi:hypothetical protein